MEKRFITALPVFNEVTTVNEVLDEVLKHSPNVLVVDDGSTDGTAELLKQRDDIILVQHEQNKGYGGALITAFTYAIENGYQILVTVDCDGQHEPQRILQFVEKCESANADIVSGSRYLEKFENDSDAPPQRREINQAITAVINEHLDFGITDAFCGFKAYRASALQRLEITETGYAMPLELWVQAACKKLSVIEVAVPLIYLDETRSFGGDLDDGKTRLQYYHEVLTRSFLALPSRCEKLQSEWVG